MSTVQNIRNITTNGLVLLLDTANPKSYVSGSTTWNDLSIGKNNGTLTNGPTFNSGNGGSIVFDGIDDNVVLGNVLNMGTDSLTINAWFKLATSPNTDNYIFSKSFYGAQNYRYGLTVSNNKLVTFIQGNGGSDIIPIGSTTFTSNVWYMATTTINRNSSITMYVNGITETLTGTATISQWVGLNFQSINPARVGSYTFSNNTTPNLMFKGNIAQVQIYNRVLSQSEILQNYNATKSRFGLV